MPCYLSSRSSCVVPRKGTAAINMRDKSKKICGNLANLYQSNDFAGGAQEAKRKRKLPMFTCEANVVLNH